MANRRGPDLNADTVRELLSELSTRVTNSGQYVQMLIVGGAAIALNYDHGRLTRDIDAIFEPAEVVRILAAEIGEKYGLEPDWINDAVAGFMPKLEDNNREVVFESEHLLAEIAGPEFLLAMKLFAVRNDKDINDAAILWNRCGYTSVDQGVELLEKSYPSRLLELKHQYSIESVLSRAAQQSDS